MGPNPICLVSLQEEEIWTQTHTQENTMWRHREKTATYKRTRRASEETNLLTPWCLQNYEKTNFCCLSHPVCGILLWQPWQTNTAIIIFQLYILLKIIALCPKHQLSARVSIMQANPIILCIVIITCSIGCLQCGTGTDIYILIFTSTLFSVCMAIVPIFTDSQSQWLSETGVQTQVCLTPKS